MPVPTLITDLSQTAGSNFPLGSDAPSSLDDTQRAHASFIALLRDGKGASGSTTLVAAATTDIGAQNSTVVEISGNTGITSFGTNYSGVRYLRFTGTPLITHSSSINFAGAANHQVVVGDVLCVAPNQGATGWNVLNIARATPTAPTQAAKDATTAVATTAFVDRLRSMLSGSTGGTMVLSDRGAGLLLATAPTIPASVFSALDVFTLYNNTASAMTVTQGASLTLRQSGTANTGNRTLPARGIATVFFVSATEAVITGCS